MSHSEKVRLVASHFIDFKNQSDGEVIRGTKLFFTRPCYDSEKGRGWNKDVVLDSVFIRADSAVVLPAFPAFPCDIELIYVPAGKYNRLDGVVLPSQKL